MSHGHICGCYYILPNSNSWYQRRQYLPQVQLNSHTTISPLSFVTKLSQTFTNSIDADITEARYTFPLYDGVAVTAFTCTVRDKVITGHVEEKAQARKTFDAAVERGESAGLLESLPLGVFGVTLGNIPANSVIKVDITYGGELKHDAQIDGLRFIIPTSIAPRYGSYPGELTKPSNAIVKGINITVDVDMQGSIIRKVQSPSKDHPISMSIGALSTDQDGSTFNPSKASVTLTHGSTELGADFVLQILIDDIFSPKALLEKHSVLSNHYALMTTFVPKFNLKPIKPEIVFIADQSGSMGGENNTSLVAALKTFIKSLPVDVHFNICAFGSKYRFLWDQSKPYTRETAKEALDFVQTFNAGYGGTEMQKPVVAAFEKHLRELPLELILITDGAITSEQRLFDFVSNKIHQEKVDARLFVLGIGASVSHTLVEGLGRAGNGFSQFVSPVEVMDYKVVRMLKAALYPHIKDYSLQLEYEDNEDDFDMVSEADHADTVTPAASTDTLAASDTPKATISLFDTSADLSKAPKDEASSDDVQLPAVTIPKILQAPQHIPALLPFNRTTIQLLLKDINQTPKSVVLRGTCSEGPLELRIPVQPLDSKDNVTNCLAARKAIQELEDGRGWLTDAKEDEVLIKDKHPSAFEKLVKNEIVRLGLEYQVANKYCSFVAVQDRESPEKDVPDQALVEEVLSFMRQRRQGGGAYQPPTMRFDACMSSTPRGPPPPPPPMRACMAPSMAPSMAPPAMPSMAAPMAPLAMPFMARSMAPAKKRCARPASNNFFASAPANELQRNRLVESSDSSRDARRVDSQSQPPDSIQVDRAVLEQYSAEMEAAACMPFDSDEDIENSMNYLEAEEEAEVSDDGSAANRFFRDDESTANDSDVESDTYPITAVAGPKSPTKQSLDPLSIVRSLIDLQEFDGTWSWTSELKSIFGKEVAIKHDATAHVLAWLQAKAVEYKDLWDMVWDKGFATLGDEKAFEAAKRDVEGC